MQPHEFKVGDGVHWGYNGDAYPGTVRKVSPSGKTVWVSKDNHQATEKEREMVDQFGMHEGSIDSTFIPVDMPESEWTIYRLNKRGYFVPKGHKGPGWSLQHGRMYAQNPSF